MQNDKNLPSVVGNADKFFEIAAKNPRNEVQVIKQVTAIATISRQSAMSCIYCRPVGKDKKGRQTFAEGASARLTEVIEAKWKNLAVKSHPLEELNGKVVMEAIVVDGESNTVHSETYSKSIVKSNGERYGSNQVQVTEAATAAIARRNAIQTVVSRIVINEILKSVKDKIMDNEEPADAWKKGVQVFGAMGVSEQQLLQAVGAANKSSVSRDNVCKLHGIFNCIKDGLVTTEECFGQVSKARVSQPKKKDKPKEEPKAEPKKDEDQGRVILAEAYEATRKALVANGHTEAENEISVRFLKAKLSGEPLNVEADDISAAIDLLSNIANELGGKK